jgi:Tripartite tricarboxylate transporter family receptor
MAESGLPEFVVETWNGLVVPAGTSPEIVSRLSCIVQDAAKDPAVRQRMAGTGMAPIGDTPEQFRAAAHQLLPQSPRAPRSLTSAPSRPMSRAISAPNAAELLLAA